MQYCADLIVLGRHEHSTITEFFIDSISNHVITNANCSILVGKDHDVNTDRGQELG